LQLPSKILRWWTLLSSALQMLAAAASWHLTDHANSRPRHPFSAARGKYKAPFIKML
jgi:hypothetical protein